jgi:hypothetical protein
MGKGPPGRSDDSGADDTRPRGPASEMIGKEDDQDFVRIFFRNNRIHKMDRTAGIT